MLKKIDKLVIKSFIGPFLASFIMSIMLLLMQFLWKYIDELVGKGLSGLVIGKLLFYSMADLVPLALPLAVMISSLMTFGNMAENLELVSLKSAGTSLKRIMLPAFVVMIFFAGVTFVFSNYIIPKANLEAKSLLYDLRNKKGVFTIKDGIFNNSLDGYGIYISKKSEDSDSIFGVIIHQRQKVNEQLLITANKGLLTLSNNNKLLNLVLIDGNRYEEMVESKNYYNTKSHNRTSFDRQELKFDLSVLDLKMTDKNLFKDDQRMLNVFELSSKIDSFNRMKDLHLGNLKKDRQLRNNRFSIKTNSEDTIQYLFDTEITSNFKKSDEKVIYNIAQNAIIGLKNRTLGAAEMLRQENSYQKKYIAERHRKFTLSAVILLLFLLSAPLGAIIRKGGLGLPFAISVVLFIIYYVINMTGEKMALSGVLPAWLGMWMSSLILLPFSIWLTHKANVDSALLNKEAYKRTIEKIFTFVKRLGSKKSKNTAS